jgi:DNA-binding winged helix-turn-helix (wHTH) protein
MIGHLVQLFPLLLRFRYMYERAIYIEARMVLLLLCLAEHAGEVVNIDDLLNQVWSGVIVSPDSVYQAVTSLRRLLGD